jgi:hypothetical protein
MAKYRVLMPLLFALVLVGCGGNGTDATTSPAPPTTVPSGTTIAADLPTTTPTGMTIPQGFPVPIPEEGSVVSAFPTEVAVLFPESEFEDLVEFYRAFSEERQGHENVLFDGGFEWQIPALQGRSIVVTVTPEPDGSLVFIRLL